MNDKYNVTFSAFFKMALLVLPGMITFVATLIPSYFGRNCLILSLFLMLCMAFAYVIALYIVYMKIDERGNSESGKVKNRTIALIYGARTAVRMGLLLFVLAECSRQLMLKRYTVIAISIPLLLACLYMGSRGTRGMVRFAESVFWFAVAAGAVVILSSVSNLDLSVLKTVTEIGDEGGANLTISRVMARGGLLFLGFSAMETVMLVYIHVIRRRRGMLCAAVGTSTIIGIICSIIVICTLGTGALMAKEKNILYIVGAMELPGGVKLRPLMLVCYLVIVFGVMALVPNVIGGWGAVDRLGVRHRWLWKTLWAVLAFAACLWAGMLPGQQDRIKIISGYLILVDVPLSIILPAASLAGKWPVKKSAGLAAVLLTACILSGCEYKPVEDVDYVNTVIIERSTEEPVGGGLRYSLVITGLDDDEDSLTEEGVYQVDAGSLADACRSYNESHAKSLDTSHVEYIVAENTQVMNEAAAELEKEFATSYVTVVIEQNILEKTGDNNTNEYLKTHYEGQCLATYARDGICE